MFEHDALRLSTTARSVLGTDLPLIGEDVTIEHFLAHRSGIGDYLDEEADHEITDYVLTVPVHELLTEQYLAVLDGHPTKFAPDERFSYCNSGYVVLALIAERVSGVLFHDLVRQRVCVPAGMCDTDFLRFDEVPERTAVGYLPNRRCVEDERLPPADTGQRRRRDLLKTADVSIFWRSLFAGRIVSSGWVTEMVRPRSEVPSESMRYGLGFWLHRSSAVVMLEGSSPSARLVMGEDLGSSRASGSGGRSLRVPHGQDDNNDEDLHCQRQAR
ncbi:MAG: serine hydrolase domain-containing protein [Pseudonocardiaceae bacterium]